MISSLLTTFFPSPVYEVCGSMLIGAIQIKLGYHLMKKNVRKLMGEEALDRHSMIRIESIILSNPFVQSIVK
jgi:divalent metal cation (Fe/Co/Zn/Cd) transporter